MKTIRLVGKRGRITIPYEIRKNMRIQHNDILSFELKDGKIEIKKERLCDCKKSELSENVNDEITLYEFLSGLTIEEQRAALVHLSMNFANSQVNRNEK